MSEIVRYKGAETGCLHFVGCQDNIICKERIVLEQFGRFPLPKHVILGKLPLSLQIHFGSRLDFGFCGTTIEQ